MPTGALRSELFYDIIETPFGWAALVLSSKGLRGLSLHRTLPDVSEYLSQCYNDAQQSFEKVKETTTALVAYCHGDLRALDRIPLDIVTTSSFYRRAWEACCKIPPGETRSYAWLAAKAGNQRAYRAAGQAMARNPVALVVPCHRVIAADGKLQGYGGGLDIKSKLLDFEKETARKLTGQPLSSPLWALPQHRRPIPCNRASCLPPGHTR